MKRRDFFKTLAVAVAAVVAGPPVATTVRRPLPTEQFDVDRLLRDSLVHDIMVRQDRAFLASLST